jgi:cytochrome P450 enzyme
MEAQLSPSTDFRFDPNDPGFNIDPYPTYTYLRDRAPLFWWAEGNAWIVTRHQDVSRTLKDPRFSLEFRYYGPAHLSDSQLNAHQLLTRYGLFWMPDADHNRVRSILAPYFTPQQVTVFREALEEVAENVLKNAGGRSDYDVVQDFSYEYQVRAVASVLGIPGDRYKDFLRFASAVLDAFYPAIGAAAYDERMSYLPNGVEMVRELIAENRAVPR